MSAPLLAQTISSKRGDGVMFAPEKGQWQISVFMGGGNKFYNENTNYYLLPTHTNTGGSVGLPNGSSNNSGDLNDYLYIDGLNNNSLTNILLSCAFNKRITVNGRLWDNRFSDFFHVFLEFPTRRMTTQCFCEMY